MLTRKQKELFDYLKEYMSSNQISPSFEEMKEAVNLKSKSGIHRLITSLEQRGFIKRLKHRARAMEIVEKSSSIKDNQIERISIPLIGMIAAGEAIEAIENSSEFISVPTSMTSPNGKYLKEVTKNAVSKIDESDLRSCIFKFLVFQTYLFFFLFASIKEIIKRNKYLKSII